MPIYKDDNGIIHYTPIPDSMRWDETGVIKDESFSICDNTNVLKQMRFEINPLSSAPGIVTFQVDVDGDTTVNLTSGSGGTAPTIEKFTLDSTDISNKYITLASTPTTPSLAVLSVIGGAEQAYGTDFTISGTQLNWNGLFLDGVLVTGDEITVLYI